jgi:hypothetical protein
MGVMTGAFYCQQIGDLCSYSLETEISSPNIVIRTGDLYGVISVDQKPFDFLESLT